MSIKGLVKKAYKIMKGRNVLCKDMYELNIRIAGVDVIMFSDYVNNELINVVAYIRENEISLHIDDKDTICARIVDILYA